MMYRYLWLFFSIHPIVDKGVNHIPANNLWLSTRSSESEGMQQLFGGKMRNRAPLPAAPRRLLCRCAGRWSHPAALKVIDGRQSSGAGPVLRGPGSAQVNGGAARSGSALV